MQFVTLCCSRSSRYACVGLKIALSVFCRHIHPQLRSKEFQVFSSAHNHVVEKAREVDKLFELGSIPSSSFLVSASRVEVHRGWWALSICVAGAGAPRGARLRSWRPTRRANLADAEGAADATHRSIASLGLPVTVERREASLASWLSG
jgi:hypothetical protein